MNRDEITLTVPLQSLVLLDIKILKMYTCPAMEFCSCVETVSGKDGDLCTAWVPFGLLLPKEGINPFKLLRAMCYHFSCVFLVFAIFEGVLCP